MKARLFWIDIVKVIAIMMVVLAHLIWMTNEAVGQTDAYFAFLTINNIVATLGVPMFVMVSGFLLFSKTFETKMEVLTFYKHNLLPLLITAELWIVVYCIIKLPTFSVKELLLNMALVHKPEVHLWYVRFIVMYYLLTPFICMLKNKSSMGFILVLVVTVTFTFGYNAWLIATGDLCPTNSNRSYFCYLAYMAAGYWLGCVNVSGKNLCLAITLVVVGGGILCFTLLKTNYFLWYDNPLLALLALGLFYLIRIMCAKLKTRQWIVEISKMSYGIYLSHFLLMYVGIWIMKYLGYSVIIFYGIGAAVLIIDVAVIAVVKRLPKLSRLIYRY
jgi:surface polysaccharide O-acyltransferase-like enzyme